MTFSTIFILLMIGVILMTLGAWRHSIGIIVLSMIPFFIGLWGIYSVFLSGI